MKTDTPPVLLGEEEGSSSSRDHAQDYIRERIEHTDGGCWRWLLSENGDGYGQANYAGKRWKAHRLAYVAFRGDIPFGEQIDHLCRNRRCCNPDHLEAVAQRENLLRGDTIAAERASRTHCKHGHQFTPENTYRDHLNRRVCRECRAALDARRYATKKAQAMRGEGSQDDQ